MAALRSRRVRSLGYQLPLPQFAYFNDPLFCTYAMRSDNKVYQILIVNSLRRCEIFLILVLAIIETILTLFCNIIENKAEIRH